MLRAKPFTHSSPLPCAHRYALCNPRITCASQHRLLRARPCTHSLPNPHTSPPRRATCPIAASHALAPCGTATPLAIRPHYPSRALSDPHITRASLRRMLRTRPFTHSSPYPHDSPPRTSRPAHCLRISAPHASRTAIRTPFASPAHPCAMRFASRASFERASHATSAQKGQKYAL